MENKVNRLLDRLQKVEDLLGQSDAVADQKKYKELTQEYSYLSEIRDLWHDLQKATKQLEESQILLSEESQDELVEFIRQEISDLKTNIETLKTKLELLLIPPDPRDNANVIMEIRAGTGGDEAALFVGDCVRMYKNYASHKEWHCEVLSATESERGGFKEYVMVFSGKNVFRLLQYEAGTHRVQRVPETETQGRVHTSAVTVAVLPEPGEEEKIEIQDADLRIETYRASGAGGQHVNTTDSAVRITHIPTGTVVTCQEERSQHKNKDKALRILGAKVAEQQRIKKEKEVSAMRSVQVGSGDRSERIRTYNFPQNRITDHRIDLTLYKLSKILDGDLDELTGALLSFFHQKKLSA
jgi:peptide chain release factor 1